MPPLVSRACLQLCRWRPTQGESLGGLPLFRCSGCGSEWIRTEEWTPVDLDGTRHDALQRDVARRQEAG